ncbi:Putative peroxiredoxin bcp [Serratia plymuthica]|nr:Putative peroxiredoxin bcp [Serratia plymuthica]
MKLQDKLDAFKAEFEAGKLPFTLAAQDHELMRRAIHELDASGAAARALKCGDKAPEFELPDAENTRFSSRDLLANGPLIINFFRGAWCPYCNIELQALEAAQPEFRSRQAQLVAISPQTTRGNRQSTRDNALTFPLLSDHGNQLAALFGLSYTLPDSLRDLYLNRLNIDLTALNLDDSGTLPMPARYLIAQDGRILYTEVNADYTRRPDPQSLLPILDALR